MGHGINLLSYTPKAHAAFSFISRVWTAQVARVASRSVVALCVCFFVGNTDLSKTT